MFVGLDVHRKVCYGTVLDDRGRVVKQGRFSNDPDSLDGFLEGLGESRVVMESGYCWQPLYDRLEEKGCDVRMAHPLKTKVIAEAKVKTDKVDSEMLAHLLRADLPRRVLGAAQRDPGSKRPGEASCLPGPYPDPAQEQGPR